MITPLVVNLIEDKDFKYITEVAFTSLSMIRDLPGSDIYVTRPDHEENQEDRAGPSKFLTK
jgi:hypothetical protein